MAEVIIKIRSELVGDGFEASKRGLDGLGQEQDKIRDKAGPMGEAVTGALRHIGTMAVEAAAQAAQSMGQFIADSISKSSQFEKQMSGVAAVSGATGEDVQKLTDYALELGSKTSYSAQEAAEGMEILAANGLTATEILSGAGEATLNLAAATGGTLTDSAAIMTDAMAVFGISAEDTSRAIDGITGVTVASKFDLQNYALALSQGGGAAMAAGMSFEDFNTSIAVLSPLFASGSDAGTSLKTMLSRLVPQTKDATGMMLELGLITEDGTNVFYDAQGNLKGMGEIAEYLNGALMGLSDAERTAALQTIFGSDAMRAAMGIAMGAGDAFDETAEAIAGVSAQKQAEVRLDNFAGSVEMMNGAMETLQITIGDIVMPVLKDLIDNVIVPAIGKAQEFVNAFAKAPDKLKFLVDAIEDMGIDLDTVIPLVGGLTAAFATFSALTFARTIPALAAMATQAWATAIPIIAMNAPLVAIAAVVGLIAAVVIANWGPLVDAFNAAGGGLEGFWAAVQLLWGIISAWAVEVGGKIATAVGQWAQSLWKWIVDSWPGVVEQLGKWWTQFTGWLDAQRILLEARMITWAIGFTIWISNAWDSALEALGKWWDSFMLWIEAQNILLEAKMITWGLGFIAWISNLWEDTKEFLGDWWDDLVLWIEAQGILLKAKMITFGFNMIGWISGLWEDTKTKLEEWYGKLKTWVEGLPEKVKTVAEGVGTAIVNGVAAGVTAAKDAVWNAIKGAVDFAIDGIMKFLGIASPSKLFRDEIGVNMGLGIADGLMASSGQIGAAGALASQSALMGATSNVVNNYNYSYSPTYNGAPNVAGDAVLVQSMAGAG